MTEEEKKRFISMERDIHDIKRGLEEISTALLGSKITKDGGLVKRIAELEEKAERLEKKAAQMEIYQKIIWGVAGGAAVIIAKILFEIILNK